MIYHLRRKDISVEKELLYKKIYDDLLEAIEKGIYSPGSKLPSEKELMEQYNVSRITSKKALEMLADRNIIVRMPGKGSFVLEENEQDRENLPAVPQTVEPVRKGKMLGVILDFFSGFFGCELIAGIEHECWSKNYHMILKCTYGNVEAESRAIDELMELGVDGIILMCVQGENYSTRIVKLALDKFPVILVDRALKGLPIPCIGTDNYRAAQDLVNILLEEGHEKICFVSQAPLETSSVEERFNGYRDTMLEHKILTNEDLWMIDLDSLVENIEETREKEKKVMEALENYVENHPQVTAFFTVDLQTGVLVYRVLQKKNLRKEIVFFDGVEEGYEFHTYCTHVMQGQYLMGAMAVKNLCRLIKGGEVELRKYVPYSIIRKDPQM